MKKLLFIFLTVFLTNCHKENEKDSPNQPKTDYRDSCVGSYRCQKKGNFFCNDGHLTKDYDTTVVVNISKYNDSLISIDNVRIKLNSEGTFGGGLYPVADYNFFEGHFKNDSIYFDTNQGGHACYTSLNYKGKKMK